MASSMDLSALRQSLHDSAVEENSEEIEQLPQWLAEHAKYAWSDEPGYFAPEQPDFEKKFFTTTYNQSAGDWFDTYCNFTVTCENEGSAVKPIRRFDEAGLHPVMVRNVELTGFKRPTPIQSYCIPAVLRGLDVIGVAQTGSGKTAAYLIPVLSKLTGKVKKLAAPKATMLNYDESKHAVRAEPLVLIVCPTRELAIQIFDHARRLCYRTFLRPCMAYGGGSRKDQLSDLKKGCDLLVGTPGRIGDFVTKEPKWLSLARVKYTILDEADLMLRDDWGQQLSLVLTGGIAQSDGDHQFLMFSATFPQTVQALAEEHLSSDHVRIKVGRTGSTHDNIEQRFAWVQESAKLVALRDLLRDFKDIRTLVFVGRCSDVDEVDDYIYHCGLPCTSIHSGRTQYQREDAIRAFRSGKIPILISSHVMGRGVEFRNLKHVINYDLPSENQGGIDTYVHRIGRTARIGHRGLATSFFNERNFGLAPDLVALLKESHQRVPDWLLPYDFAESGFSQHSSTGQGSAWSSGHGQDAFTHSGSSAGRAQRKTSDVWGQSSSDTKWGESSSDTKWGEPSSDAKWGASSSVNRWGPSTWTDGPSDLPDMSPTDGSSDDLPDDMSPSDASSDDQPDGDSPFLGPFYLPYSLSAISSSPDLSDRSEGSQDSEDVDTDEASEDLDSDDSNASVAERIRLAFEQARMITLPLRSLEAPSREISDRNESSADESTSEDRSRENEVSRISASPETTDVPDEDAPNQDELNPPSSMSHQDNHMSSNTHTDAQNHTSNSQNDNQHSTPEQNNDAAATTDDDRHETTQQPLDQASPRRHMRNRHGFVLSSPEAPMARRFRMSPESAHYHYNDVRRLSRVIRNGQVEYEIRSWRQPMIGSVDLPPTAQEIAARPQQNRSSSTPSGPTNRPFNRSVALITTPERRPPHSTHSSRTFPGRQARANQQSPSRQQASRQQAPRQQAPRQQAPRQQAPRQQALHQQAPRQLAPRQQAPGQQAPRQYASHHQASRRRIPRQPVLPLLDAPPPPQSDESDDSDGYERDATMGPFTNRVVPQGEERRFTNFNNTLRSVSGLRSFTPPLNQENKENIPPRDDRYE